VESRRVRRLRLPAILAGALAACTLEYAPPESRQGWASRDADTTVVLEELRGYYRDLSARDWTAYADRFWPGATITTIWQPGPGDSARVWVTSVPDFVAAAQAGPDNRAIFEETMRDARIRVRGALAQAWVHYQARFGDPGMVEEWEGVDAITLMRHGGRWRIVALAFGATDGGP
jgi:hypothetical protein